MREKKHQAAKLLSNPRSLHGGTAPWSTVGLSASTHLPPCPIPGREKEEREIYPFNLIFIKPLFKIAKERNLGRKFEAGIPGGQLLRAPNSQRPPRATKAR